MKEERKDIWEQAGSRSIVYRYFPIIVELCAIGRSSIAGVDADSGATQPPFYARQSATGGGREGSVRFPRTGFPVLRFSPRTWPRQTRAPGGKRFDVSPLPTRDTSSPRTKSTYERRVEKGSLSGSLRSLIYIAALCLSLSPSLAFSTAENGLIVRA
jgi:hypothetical protein